MKTISIIFASLLIRLTGILKQIRLQVILILGILFFSGCNEFSQKKIKAGAINLPDTVQWLNTNSEQYFIGNGIIGGGGDIHGNLDFLIGPDYTSPNFIKSAKLLLQINKKQVTLAVNIHRVKGTGMYYGCSQVGDLKIHVLDFVVSNSPLYVRHIVFENNSGKHTQVVEVSSEITPGKNIKSSIYNNSGVLLHADTTAPLFGNGDGGNWKNRYLLVLFKDLPFIGTTDPTPILSTGEITIPTTGNKEVSLMHYFVDESTEKLDDSLKNIHARSIRKDIDATVKYWKNWLKQGNIAKSREQRVNDIIESMLIGIKMQQNRCGGFIPGVRSYAFSYIRDSYSACRGLLSCGFTKEAEKFIEITNHKFGVFKEIPNSVQMGYDSHTHYGGNQYAECPAYVVMLMRDIYKINHDLNFLKQNHDLLKYAIDIQLRHAKEENWLLPFNGDETEQYTVKKDGEIIGIINGISIGLPGFHKDIWSLTSLASCVASLDFYIQYLELSHLKTEISTYENYKQKLLESIEINFFNSDLGYLDWAKRRDNTFFDYRVTNFGLMPLWFGVELTNEMEKITAKSMAEYINPTTGFLPMVPNETEGFSGNTMGYLLYGLTELNDKRKDNVFNTLIDSNIVQMFGMVNEFYGPNAVPNPHNLRPFESGIVLESIIKYIETKKK